MKIVQNVLRIAMLCFIACTALPAAAADPRYVISGDEVYDKETELTWKRCSVGMRWKEGRCVGVQTNMSWMLALNYIEKTKVESLGGWRLPTSDALATLINYQRKSLKLRPFIDVDAFPDLSKEGATLRYWTTEAPRSVIDFGDGTRFHYNSIDAHYLAFAVRLVKGGQ